MMDVEGKPMTPERLTPAQVEAIGVKWQTIADFWHDSAINGKDGLAYIGGFFLPEMEKLIAHITHQQQEIEKAQVTLDGCGIPRVSTLKNAGPAGDVTVSLWNRIAWLASQLATLRKALIFCSGSADFNEGGQAREGWLKLCAPLLASLPASHSSARVETAEADLRPCTHRIGQTTCGYPMDAPMHLGVAGTSPPAGRHEYAPTYDKARGGS